MGCYPSITYKQYITNNRKQCKIQGLNNIVQERKKNISQNVCGNLHGDKNHIIECEK